MHDSAQRKVVFFILNRESSNSVEIGLNRRFLLAMSSIFGQVRRFNRRSVATPEGDGHVFQTERRRHDSPGSLTAAFRENIDVDVTLCSAIRRKLWGANGVCSPEIRTAPFAHPRRLCCSYRALRSSARGDRDIAAEILEKPNRGYGDMTSETDVNISTTRAFTGMIDTVIEQPTAFLVPIA